MKKIFLTLVLISTFLTSCSFSNINEYSDFVGVWKNNEDGIIKTLSIENNGKVTYSTNKKEGKKTLTKRFSGYFNLTDSILSITVKKFTVNTFPETKNVTVFITLDGVEFTRSQP